MSHSTHPSGNEVPHFGGFVFHPKPYSRNQRKLSSSWRGDSLKKRNCHTQTHIHENMQRSILIQVKINFLSLPVPAEMSPGAVLKRALISLLLDRPLFERFAQVYFSCPSSCSHSLGECSALVPSCRKQTSVGCGFVWAFTFQRPCWDLAMCAQGLTLDAIRTVINGWGHDPWKSTAPGRKFLWFLEFDFEVLVSEWCLCKTPSPPRILTMSFLWATDQFSRRDWLIIL